MTAEQSKHLFDRFWRADLSGLIAGTGLGMSIVKEIVDAHHGQIEVVSQPNQGTAITVWLPLLTKPHTDFETLKNSALPAETQLSSKPSKVFDEIYEQLINSQFIFDQQLTTLQVELGESKRDAFQLFNAAVKNYDYSAALFLIENLK